MTVCSTAHATIVMTSNTFASDGNTAQSTGTTSNIDCTGANFIAVAIGTDFLDAVSNITITDTAGGNSYSHTTEATDSTGNHHGVFWYAANANVSSTMRWTITCSGGTCNVGAVIACYSGVATSTPFDVENSSTPASTTFTNLATNQIVPTLNNELVIAAGETTNNSANKATVNGGFTWEQWSLNSIAGSVSNYADLIQGSAGVAASTFTYTSAEDGVGIIASFKPLSATGGFNKLFRLSGDE